MVFESSLDKLAAARLRLSDGRRRLTGHAAQVTRLLGPRVPQRLLFAPQDLRTTDPTIAADIYAGHLTLGGRLVETHGRSPFDLPAPGDGFAEALHGFLWLRHFRAADAPLMRLSARALVVDWINRFGRRLPHVAERPHVAARRLISWLAQSPLLLEGADGSFYRGFVQALAGEARRLDRALPLLPNNEQKLRVLIALTSHGLACSDLDTHLKRWTRQLCAELDAQILPDGGHVSRNPALVIEFLLDILPMGLAFTSRRLQTPEALLNAVDRMLAFLRFMRHADGALGLFNGMGLTPLDHVATILAQDDPRPNGAHRAPDSGYERLAAGQTVVLIDVGRTPLAPRAGAAHAGALAFELSSGGQRILVNCGGAPAHRPALHAASRLAAAHTTLVVDDLSPGVVANGQLLRAIRQVTSQRDDTPTGLTLSATHDGFKARAGLMHERVLTLGADGRSLAGTDSLRAVNAATLPDLGYTLRFHLHPAVRAAPTADRNTVYLRPPNGTTWVFEAQGHPIAVEDSIFFGAAETTRRTEQLVVRARTGTTAALSWSLRQVG